MNSFNKTEAAVFVQAMLPEGFPFHQFFILKNLQISGYVYVVRLGMNDISILNPAYIWLFP